MAKRSNPTLVNQWFANPTKDLLSGLVVAFAFASAAASPIVLANDRAPLAAPHRRLAAAKAALAAEKLRI